MTLRDDFTHVMLENYTLAGRATGYWGHYFLREVKKLGGLTTAQKMLARTDARGKTKGFLALVQAGRPDLSVEALVLSERFRSLFTKTELNTASARLAEFPGQAHRRQVPIAEVFPELIPWRTYAEGASRRVVVNAYERNAAARRACIRRHGTRCAVCAISFAEVYGPIGRDFIHVHHKKPLAALDRKYRIDPARDLAPVCPNCHAMLHTSDPPLGIDELKAALAARAG